MTTLNITTPALDFLLPPLLVYSNPHEDFVSGLIVGLLILLGYQTLVLAQAHMKHSHKVKVLRQKR